MVAISQLEENVRAQLLSYITISSVPAAVSELLQNSVDARATKVRAKVDLATFSVMVQDDGIGMDTDSLRRAGQRHFTSKLKRLQQLLLLTTFGFRGEALSSLGTVSDVTITSRVHDTWRVVVGQQPKRIDDEEEAEQVFAVGPLKGPGTVVTALNMFQNVPVRRCQLQKVPLVKVVEELKLEVVKCLLMHPEVLVEVAIVESGRERVVVMVPKRPQADEQFSQLLRAVYGSSLLPNYEKVAAKFLSYQLDGIIGTVPSQSRNYQFLFVNGRHIQLSEADSKDLNKIFISSTFGDVKLSPSKAKARSCPVFCINFTCPVEIGDLLQDPSKSVLHSSHWLVIAKMTAKVFASFISKHGYSESLSQNALSSPKRLAPKRLQVDWNSPTSKRASHYSSPGRESQYSSLHRAINTSPSPKLTVSSPTPIRHIHEQSSSKQNISLESIQRCRVIRQIDKKFILVVAKNCKLMIIDQHACHERITVEEVLTELWSFRERTPISPVEIQVNSVELDLLLEYRSSFDFWGIEYDVGGTGVVVRAVPVLMRDVVGPVLGRGILQHAYDLHVRKKKKFPGSSWYSQVESLPSILLDTANSKACRSSIKFGDELSAEEMGYLVRKLGRCQQPFQCAHGRPCVVPLVDISE